MIILDTDVLMEVMKASPDPSVAAWLSSQDRQSLATTVFTEAELAMALAAIPRSKQRDLQAAAMARLLAEGLGGRILPFTGQAAAAYAGMQAPKPGAPPNGSMIIATAEAHGAKALASRRLSGAKGSAVVVVDPWKAPPRQG